MSINFDHSQNNSVNLKTEDLQGSGILNIPVIESNAPIQVLVSGNLNISHISGLSDCLSSITTQPTGFYYTNNVNTNCSYSYAMDSGSVAEVCNSIIFGSHGVAKVNYCYGQTGSEPNADGSIHSQIVHSISPFITNGDAQNTIFLSKSCTLNNLCNCLIYGSLCENTVLHANFDVVGKSYIDNGYRLGVFNVKTSLYRGSDNCICTGFFNLNTLVNCSIHQDFSISITGTNAADWALFVCNASGVQWLTRASVLEISATGAEAISTIAIYWKCTANSGWFNLSNWFSDQYVTTALSYPTSSTNVVMSGDCAAFVNMDCNLWVQPNSIDTTRVTDTDGVCLYSNATKSFYKDIYGNVTLYGNAIFGDFIEGTYWRNEINTNWFNLSNWFVENSFQEAADRLPLSVSDVFIYGNSGVCIDMGCNLWVQPRSIDARNSTAEANTKVCIYSQNPCSFSGIVYGGVTLYGNASFS
jgi:hypothetical protein